MKLSTAAAKFYYSTNEIKINVEGLVICGYGISKGKGGPNGKIMEIPGGGGEYYI